MPRPRKHRRVWHEPLPAIFKPVGVPLRYLETITLLHEELEALRLTDLEGRYQADAAEQMGVSRSTVQRIVTEARRKVTQALVEEAALHVEGGTFRFSLIIAMLAASILVGVLGWTNVHLVGDSYSVSGQFPLPALPDFSAIPALLLPAFALALVGVIQGSGVSQGAPNPDGHYR